MEIEKKIECFSVSEQKKIEHYILNEENSSLFGVVLCLYTGLRIGELLALEWSDIDMRKGELLVNKTCYYGKDENNVFSRITDVPKTQSSIRTIPIPKQLMPHLREAKKKSRSTHIVSNGENLISILPENDFLPLRQPGYEKWMRDWLGNGQQKEINEYLKRNV